MRPDDSALIGALLESSANQRCRLSLPTVQSAVGEMQTLASTTEGCGGRSSIADEFRMCIQRDAQPLPKEVAFYAREGAWHYQAVNSSSFLHANGCRQNALFHFQEWKKLWDASAEHMHVAALEPQDTLKEDLAFGVSTDGIHLLPSH